MTNMTYCDEDIQQAIGSVNQTPISTESVPSTPDLRCHWLD